MAFVEDGRLQGRGSSRARVPMKTPTWEVALKRMIAAVLIAVVAAPAARAGERRQTAVEVESSAMGAEASARDRDIERIGTALECPRVRRAAATMGLDPDRLETGLPRLTNRQLQRLAGLAEAHHKPGGCVRLDFPWWFAPAVLLGFLAVVAGAVAGIVGIINAVD